MQQTIEVDKTDSKQNHFNVQKTIGKYRWTICGLIFFATTINYLDRQVISLLKSVLSEQLHPWNEYLHNDPSQQVCTGANCKHDIISSVYLAN